MADLIVNDVMIDDVLVDADPALDAPDAMQRLAELRAALRPILNEVAQACAVPSRLQSVIASMRDRAAAFGTTEAFDIFIGNLT